MASIFMVNNTVLRVSNPNFPTLSPSNKVSSVCFTSTSKNLNNQYAKKSTWGKGVVKATGEDKEVDAAGDKYKEVKHQAEDTAQSLEAKAKAAAQEVSDALQGGQDKAEGDAEVASKNIGEAIDNAKDWAKDNADSNTEKAKEGADFAADAIQNAKEGAEGAFEKAKASAQKIIDT